MDLQTTGSPIRVFIVDDSTVFRSQIRAALEREAGIEVVGYARDGRAACDALRTKKVDVVTLDMEMPVMDGLQTLQEIKRLGIDVHVIIFSSHTLAGAQLTLSALEAGASDFLLKPQGVAEPGQSPAEMIRKVLVPKVRQFRTREATDHVGTVPIPETVVPTNWHMFNPEVVVIASSTGGPSALEQLFGYIQPPVSCPILIAQHMPPVFTAALAERLQRIHGLPVVEGKDGMFIHKGHVYVAPGDYHMRVVMRDNQPAITLDSGPQRNSVRPAADYLFESAASIFENGTLGIVLTGMGNDGRDGAVAIKSKGGAVLIQEKNSCVVFGMPRAVLEAKAFDIMGDIPSLASVLVEFAVCGRGYGNQYA